MDYFDYSPDLSNLDVESFLDESQEIERQLLEDEIERIEEQLERRHEIHEEALEELVSKKEWYSEHLELLYKRSVGKATGERDRLKNRIEEFTQKIRDSKRSHWLDRQELEKERRELIRLLEEVEDGNVFEFL